MSRDDARRAALSELDRIVDRGGDADDVLRAIVAALGDLYESVAIAFVEESGLVTGPASGPPAEAPVTVPVSFAGAQVAELRVAPADGDDVGFLERVALLSSPYCLVGWDTGGVAWDDL